MTYLFDNYETKVGVLNAELIDPTIEVNKETIITNDITKTISCEVKLSTPNGSWVGTYFADMPRNGTGWDDSDLPVMIMTKLQEFAI